MHLEFPKVRLESLKDFFKHYLMIVLSILTALGLEAWIEHAHHQHAAEMASTQIEAEIHANLAQIEQARAANHARSEQLGRVRARLIEDLQRGVANASAIAHARTLMPSGLFLDLRWPVLRREAWDVAVANESAGWIEPPRLRGYSTVYALQEASSAMQSNDLDLVLDGPRMNDAMVDLQVGRLAPREMLHVVNQMAWATQDAARILESLASKMRAAIEESASAAG